MTAASRARPSSSTTASPPACHKVAPAPSERRVAPVGTPAAGPAATARTSTAMGPAPPSATCQ